MAATDAEGREAVARTLLAQFVRKRQYEASAGGGDWVAECDGATIDVDLAGIELAKGRFEADHVAAVVVIREGFNTAEHLRSKRFVQFDDVEVVHGDAGAIERERSCVHWA